MSALLTRSAPPASSERTSARSFFSQHLDKLPTVAALVSLGGVEPMLQFHLGAGLHVGLTEAQLRQLIGLCEAAVGQPQADAARAVLAKVLEAGKK